MNACTSKAFCAKNPSLCLCIDADPMPHAHVLPAATANTPAPKRPAFTREELDACNSMGEARYPKSPAQATPEADEPDWVMAAALAALSALILGLLFGLMWGTWGTTITRHLSGMAGLLG